jgi:hypothetical protein
VLASCQDAKVDSVPTGGTATAPTIRETVAADADEQNQTSCRRIGCDRPATLIWTERTTGKQMAYCAEDGVEAFNLITRWLGEPAQRLAVEEHRVEVENALGRGLYGAELNRLYRGEPGNMR